MTPPLGSQSAAALTSELARRCADLGLPFVRCAAQGRITSVHAPDRVVEQWLRSGPCARLVECAVADWAELETPRPVEIFEDAWLIPLRDARRRRRATWTVVAAFGAGATKHDLFNAGVEDARMELADANHAWRAMPVHTAGSVEVIWKLLNWQQADLERASGFENALESFTEELSAAYEEIALLHKISSALNELRHPNRFVAQACEDLQGTLSYRWISICFVNEAGAARMMAGRQFASGDLPCDAKTFRTEATPILRELDSVEENAPTSAFVHEFNHARDRIIAYPIRRGERVIGGILAGDKEGIDEEISSADIKMIQAAASFVTIMVENASLYDDQQLMFLGTLEALSASIDAKDPYTCGHSERVAYLSAQIALACGLSEPTAERVRIAGLIHDVGKIGVPESVLSKPGRLTDEEYDQIKLHPEIGYQIVKDIPLLDDTLPGILHHHERYDGRGYPKGLIGEDIPFMARIIGLADAFDAMSSTRTYRSAMPREKVLQEIQDGAGTQFDPRAVEAFSHIDLTQYDEMVRRHQQQSERGGIRLRLSGEAA